MFRESYLPSSGAHYTLGVRFQQSVKIMCIVYVRPFYRDYTWRVRVTVGVCFSLVFFMSCHEIGLCKKMHYFYLLVNIGCQL
jgi:hypothetical protein